MPALVKSDGRLLTVKFGGTGAPLTLAVNCVNRSLTRFAVIEIVGPADRGAGSRLSTPPPAKRRAGSVAPPEGPPNPPPAAHPPAFPCQVGAAAAPTTGAPPCQ